MQSEVMISDFSELDRDAMEVSEDFWSMSVDLNFSSPRYAQSVVDGVWNIEACRTLSEHWSGSARFRILSKRDFFF